MAWSIFEQAKELQPSIIYFDEIDSIAQQRSSGESLRFDSKFVNQLLTLMDGIEDYGNICVIASTNRKELLDDAILRPGRFDFEIEIKKPTLKGCFEIFSKCIKKMPVDKIFDVNSFCKNLYGLTGADIAFVVREGAYMCLRRILDLSKLLYRDNFKKEDYSKLIIKKQDFEEALKIVKDKNLFTADDPFIYRKYLNTADPNGSYYTCQFCGTIHKGYYTNCGLNIDFRSLNI